MQSRRKHHSTNAQRGGAAIILVNLLLIVLIVAIAGGYYIFQMRPARAAEAFARALEMERKGHITSAELEYRKAIRLDPGNARYHLSLKALESGEGNIKDPVGDEIVPPGPGTASAALWGDMNKTSSTPSLAAVESGSPAGAVAATAPAQSPPKAEPAPKIEPHPEPVDVRKKVELEIAAPGEAEFEIRAVDAGLYVPGEIVQSWSPAENGFQRDLAAGEYKIMFRVPDSELVEETFSVTKDGAESQTEKFRYGLLKIESAPESARVYEEGSAKLLGKTPFTALKSVGDVAYLLKAEGFESSSVAGKIESRGVLHFNHQLAKVAPPPQPERVPAPDPKPEAVPAKSAPVIVQEPRTAPPLVSAPAIVETPKPAEPPPTVRPAETEQPVFGRPFVNEDGVEFVYSEKSNRGDPYWMSSVPRLRGWEKADAQRYCAELTAKERAKGRVPEGYAYFPSIAGDGRIALCMEYRDEFPPQDGSPGLAGSGAGPVVVRAEVLPTVRVAEVVEPASSGIEYGESFVNGDRIWMEFREEDVHGNPFWRSAQPVAHGMSSARAGQYCRELTAQELAAGRIPEGYAYYMDAEGDGRVVLWRNARSRVTVSR